MTNGTLGTPLAGEYLRVHGAPAVVFCERGIRGFDGATRNLLDLGAVALLAHVHRLPVVVDPSHAVGRRDLIAPLARAALAAGAAGVMIETHDDPGRERLCRYGARPPFSLARLRVLKNGNVSYLVTKVGRGRAKHRVMEPVEFLARISALVPPPRFPLIRFAGVLAPRSKLRPLVVPRPPTATSDSEPSHRAPGGAKCETLELVAVATPERPSRVAEATEPERVPAASPAVFAHTLAAQNDAVEIVAPNVLSMAHWARLLDGELYAGYASRGVSSLRRARRRGARVE